MSFLQTTKFILTSKGVWGGILAISAGALTIFGYDLNADEQANLIEIITTLGSGIVSAVGGVLAIIGRVKATKKIRWKIK